MPSPLSFATTPQGQREMDNVRTMLEQDLRRNAQEAQRRAMFRTPALAPYPQPLRSTPPEEFPTLGGMAEDFNTRALTHPPSLYDDSQADSGSVGAALPPAMRPYKSPSPQAIEDVARHMQAAPAGNPFADGMGLSSVQGLPQDKRLADMATAFNQQADSAFQRRTPPSGVPANATAQELQHNADFDARFQQQRDLAQAQQQALQLAQDVGRRTQTGIRPDQSATAGLLAGNPAADGGMFADTRWQAGGRMSGYRPQSIGLADPRTREALMRQRGQITPMSQEDAMRTLQTLAPALMNQAKSTGPNGPALTLPREPAERQKAIAQQGTAERIRELMSDAMKQQAAQIPVGINGNPSTAERLAGKLMPNDTNPDAFQQRQNYLLARKASEAGQIADARASGYAAEKQARLDQRNQRAKDEANGLHPSFRAAQEAIAKSGGAGMGGGLMTPAQFQGMAMLYGPEAAAQYARVTAEAAAADRDARLKEGMFDLQKQIAKGNMARDAAVEEAKFTPDHNGALLRIRSTPGGFRGMTPAMKEQVIRDSLKSANNWITQWEAEGKHEDLGITPEEAIEALRFAPPPFKPGWIAANTLRENQRRKELGVGGRAAPQAPAQPPRAAAPIQAPPMPMSM